jgi:uncharacterized protein (DUF1501 family)
MMVRSTRRSFIKGGLAVTAYGLAQPTTILAGQDPDILVVIFLRGGMDGLSLLPPVSGPDRALYEAARPTLKVPVTGDGAAITLDGGFGLHPAAAPLLPLYDGGRVAVVHATGMHDPTRSHFEAQDYLELGTPGDKTIGSGWLHRHLQTAPDLPPEIMIPALASGTLQPMSLFGSGETLTLDDPEIFRFDTGPRLWNDAQNAALRTLYGLGDSAVNAAGLQSINSVDIVQTHVTGDYVPAGDAVYGDDDAGSRFELAAQMLSLDLGIQVVTLDVGGWDTHENQGAGTQGAFAGLVSSISQGVAAFMTDMDARGLGQRLTVVLMTEFGRRLDENADQGTDHGHAVPMLLVGDNVVGGLHGTWPGLEPRQLFEGVDLEVTTDFRRVLSEVLIERLGNTAIDRIFPGYQGYQALGVVSGGSAAPPRRVTGIRVP